MDLTRFEKARPRAVALLEAERGRPCDESTVALRLLSEQRRQLLIMAVGLVALMPLGAWATSLVAELFDMAPETAEMGGWLSVLVVGPPMAALVLWAHFRLPNHYVIARFGDEAAVVALQNFTGKPQSVDWFAHPAPVEITAARRGLAARISFDGYTLYFPTAERLAKAQRLLGLVDEQKSLAARNF